MALVARNPPANAGDIRDGGSIAGSGRTPGKGHGNPLQYSCLENLTDRDSHGLPSIGLHRVEHNRSDLACTISKHALDELNLYRIFKKQ